MNANSNPSRIDPASSPPHHCEPSSNSSIYLHEHTISPFVNMTTVCKYRSNFSFRASSFLEFSRIFYLPSRPRRVLGPDQTRPIDGYTCAHQTYEIYVYASIINNAIPQPYSTTALIRIINNRRLIIGRALSNPLTWPLGAKHLVRHLVNRTRSMILLFTLPVAC